MFLHHAMAFLPTPNYPEIKDVHAECSAQSNHIQFMCPKLLLSTNSCAIPSQQLFGGRGETHP